MTSQHGAYGMNKATCTHPHAHAHALGHTHAHTHASAHRYVIRSSVLHTRTLCVSSLAKRSDCLASGNVLRRVECRSEKPSAVAVFCGHQHVCYFRCARWYPDVEGKMTVVSQAAEFIGKDEWAEDMLWHLLAELCSTASSTGVVDLWMRKCIVIPTRTLI